MKKRIISTLIAAIMVFTATLGVACADTKAISFKDISANFWAKANIDTLVERGGISGYPDGTFKPNSTITAAEFVKIALSLLDNAAVDTEGYSGTNWYKPYAAKAVEIGIVPEDMFNETTWKQSIPRQKMAVISIKVAMALKEDMTIENRSALEKKFKDYDDICKYCKEYVIDAVGKGIVNGYSDGTFRPEASATRAEATAMLVRVIDQKQRLDVNAVAEKVTYTTGSHTYTVPYVTHTFAELGLVKAKWNNGWTEIYTTSPEFFLQIETKNGPIAGSPALNVSTNLRYERKGEYYVYEISQTAERYKAMKENAEGTFYVAIPGSTIGNVYFPEKTAVRISDMDKFNFEN